MFNTQLREKVRKELVLNKIITNAGYMQKKYDIHLQELPELYEQVILTTNFLPSTADLKERMYVIGRNITKRVMCTNEKCNNPSHFRRGMYTRCCSDACAKSQIHKGTKSAARVMKHHKDGRDAPVQPSGFREFREFEEDCMIRYHTIEDFSDLVHSRM